MANNRNPLAYTGRELATTARAGLAQLDSTDFSVTDGKVSLSGTGALENLTQDSGSTTPSSGIIKIAGGEGIDTSGATNIVTVAMETATTSNVGGGEIATDAEAIAASVSTNKFLVPSNLAAITATNMTALKASSNVTCAGTSTATFTTPAGVRALKDYTDITFTCNPVLTTAANTAGVATGSTGDVNLMVCQEGEILEQFILGAGQTIIGPRMEADGLLISLDLTDNEGAEYNWGILSSGKHYYTAQTDGPFFIEASFKLADVTGVDPLLIGFRKASANNADYTSFTDYALIGVHESVTTAVVTIEDRLNSGAANQTNTTDAWADGETHVLRVNVSAAGVVTYTIDGIAPTQTAAFTFDADPVIPMIHFLHGTTTPGKIHCQYIKCGLYTA